MDSIHKILTIKITVILYNVTVNEPENDTIVSVSALIANISNTKLWILVSYHPELFGVFL